MNIHSTFNLKGKKILFLSVQTFNLEKEIIKKLEEYGAIVTYYDERPNNHNLTKGLIRLNKKFLQSIINHYYNSIITNIEGEIFDFLFINRAEVVPEEFLIKFIKKQPQCIRIFYTWDSFKNHNHAVSLLKYFHKSFTFDRIDAQKYEILFRPLYFMDTYRISYSPQEEKKYDVIFLGTAHSDRYIISNKIANWCYQHNLNIFFYYYIPSKFVYFYKKFFDSTFKEFDFKKLKFQSLSINEIIDLYKNSFTILDINHPNQTGLTMRTFEAIGLKKKLITTNQDIIHYPFYNPNNIYIIDRNNINLDKSFFCSPYQDIDPDLYETCSIDGWVKDIFSDEISKFWKK